MLITIRSKVFTFTERAWFKRVVITVIVANSVTLGLETYPNVMAQYGQILLQLDRWFLTFFVVELVLKMFGQGQVCPSAVELVRLCDCSDESLTNVW